MKLSNTVLVSKSFYEALSNMPDSLVPSKIEQIDNATLYYLELNGIGIYSIPNRAKIEKPHGSARCISNDSVNFAESQLVTSWPITAKRLQTHLETFFEKTQISVILDLFKVMFALKINQNKTDDLCIYAFYDGVVLIVSVSALQGVQSVWTEKVATFDFVISRIITHDVEPPVYGVVDGHDVVQYDVVQYDLDKGC